jgi:hypothetical protein
MGKGRRAHIPRNSSDLGALAPILSDMNMHKPRLSAPKSPEPHGTDDSPLFVLITTYLSYFILIVFGHFRDILDLLNEKYNSFVLGTPCVESSAFSRLSPSLLISSR